LGFALALGGDIGTAAGLQPRSEAIAKGLQSLAEVLDFRSMSETLQFEQALVEFGAGFDEPTKSSLALTSRNLDVWKANVRELLDE
jgi:hypothetical protein